MTTRHETLQHDRRDTHDHEPRATLGGPRLREAPRAFVRAAIGAAVAATFLLIGPSLVAVPADPPTDEKISDAVEREYLHDGVVYANNIDVATDDGIVSLTGTVRNLLAKERAVRIAKTVKGVQSVIDRTTVEIPYEVADSRLRKTVRTALLADPATDEFETDVQVDDGHVTLTGTVDSWREKMLCEKVAKNVKGVRGLSNHLGFSGEVDRADDEIREEIVQTLRFDVLVDDSLVDVSVDDGVVALSGTVGSASEKTRAEVDAWTSGVTDVTTGDLEVARWARDEDLRKEKYIPRTDDQVHAAVAATLLRDPRVSPFGVKTEVDDGIVTLRGNVDSLRIKRAAEQDARNTVGVISVQNFLKVRFADAPTDEQIAKDIRQAIARDPFVERYETIVSVHDGHAYVTGAVDSYFEKARLDDLVAGVRGVHTISNRVLVPVDMPFAYDPYVDDWDTLVFDWYYETPTVTAKTDAEIARDIRGELWWSPFVDAKDIEVSVDAGVATLSGEVESWNELRTAVENAYEGGATIVKTRFDIEP